jgi:hypothetical protein
MFLQENQMALTAAPPNGFNVWGSNQATEDVKVCLNDFGLNLFLFESCILGAR